MARSRWVDQDIDNAKPKLPALPPLVTAQVTPERTLRDRDQVPIGWSQIKSGAATLSSGPSPSSSSDASAFSPHSASSVRTRRPPPPLVGAESLSPRINNNSAAQRAQRTPASPLSYKSPFVGEQELFEPITRSNSKARVFKSPFVGDSSVLMPAALEGGKLEWTNQIDNGSPPEVIFSNDPRKSDEMKGLKALPPLPPRNQNSALLSLDELAGDNVAQLNLGVGPLEKSDKNFEEPLKPFTNDMRHRSDKRTISDSISSYYSSSNYAFNDELGKHSSFNSIAGNRPLQHVPSVTAPTQPFSIDLLDENKLYQCYTVSLLSDIYEWLLKVYFEWFNEYVFHKIEFFQMVQLLLEFQLPVSCDQDIVDSNVDRVIESLVLQGAVRFEGDTVNSSSDEITIIVAGLAVQGVFTTLLPCYSYEGQRILSNQDPHCYCPRCPSKFMKQSRPVLKVSEIINKSVGLWTDYWKLTPEELTEINPREVKRQSLFFDLIILEERSLNLANAAVEIYGSQFDPSLLPEDPNFKKLAFDIFEPMVELHKEYLLTPLFWKLKSRGKFIDGVGKFYLQWCNSARELYVQYAESMATVHEIISWEKAHKTRFSLWLKDIDNSPEISRSKLYHDVIFFGGFFKALQNIPVTLSSILKCTDQSMEDYEYLKLAIADIKALNATVDTVHGNAIDHRRVVRFARQLVLGSGSNSSTVGYVNINDGNPNAQSAQEKLDLRLNEKSRKLLNSGPVHKKRELWIENAQLYLVLLDNYLLITEDVTRNNETKYKLCERPIPIDYLSLESKEDLKLSKFSSDQQEHSSLESRSNSRPAISAAKSNRLSLYGSRFSPLHSKTLHNEMQALQNKNESSDHQESSITFKVRNTATNESFTFSTSTIEERDAWVSSLVSCFKAHHAKNNSRIFLLSCLTDMFSYEEGQAPTNLPVVHEGSAIDSALKAYYAKIPPEKEGISAEIRCTVLLPYEGKTFVLCATNQSIYMRCADYSNKWKNILILSKVTRMQANVRLGLFFVLADRRLCYFNIPSIVCAYFGASEYLSQKQITGIILQEKVGFFKVVDDFGNSRQLFFERKGKIVVLTPEFDRLTKKLKFFKFYKEYRLPSSANGLVSTDVKDIAVFPKSFIVCSSKGALLFNDSFNDVGLFLPSFLNDKTISDHQHHFTHHAVKSYKDSLSKMDSSKQKMASYVKTDILNRKTSCVGCFQLSDNDFIIIYDEAVLRVNKNGEIPDWKADILVLDFYCLAASLTEEFLILFGENLVQIYDLNYAGIILNNKLSRLTPIQIIKSKKIKLIHSDRTESPTITLSHPSIPGRQLVLAFQLEG